jgi:hypothetical protein
MILTLLLCLLFFLGDLALRKHWQALAFLALGAGYQLMTYALPAPGLQDGAAPDSATVILVSLSSGAGYIAWRLTRDRMKDGLLNRNRIGIFAGVGLNVVIAAVILWQTGTLVLPD